MKKYMRSLRTEVILVITVIALTLEVISSYLRVNMNESSAGSARKRDHARSIQIIRIKFLHNTYFILFHRAEKFV